MRSPSLAALRSTSSSSALLIERTFSSMSSRLTMLASGNSDVRRVIDVVRQPAVRIERPGEPVHADPAAVELELLDAAGDRVRPGLGARADVAHPVLRRAPAFEEGRHLHDRGGLALGREHQHVELGVAADRREVAGVGGVEVPHGRPAPQHDGVEVARRHLLAHGGPAPVTLGEREAGEFEVGRIVDPRRSACMWIARPAHGRHDG